MEEKLKGRLKRMSRTFEAGMKSPSILSNTKTGFCIVNCQQPVISPYAVHHCIRHILLRAEKVSSTKFVKCSHIQVALVAESVLTFLSKGSRVYLEDGNTIPKQFHSFIMDVVYEEFLSRMGTPTDVIKAFNSKSPRLRAVFYITIVKVVENKKLVSCLYYQSPNVTLGRSCSPSFKSNNQFLGTAASVRSELCKSAKSDCKVPPKTRKKSCRAWLLLKKTKMTRKMFCNANHHSTKAVQTPSKQPAVLRETRKWFRLMRRFFCSS